MGFETESDILRRARKESLDLENKEGIIGPDNVWGAYDSHLTSFDSRFGYQELLGIPIPENESAIATYLNKTYEEEKGSLVAIELGGVGSKLFSDLAKYHIFRKTAGFTLGDSRDSEQKTTDSEINHDVVEANIFSSSFADDKCMTWAKS